MSIHVHVLRFLGLFEPLSTHNYDALYIQNLLKQHGRLVDIFMVVRLAKKITSSRFE